MSNLFAALPGCLAALILLAGCGHRNEPAEAASSSTAQLTRGLSGEPSSLDPAGITDNFSIQVIQDLYEGLTAESAVGAVIPAVAASWDIDPGGLEYTFHLRPEARWSNGAPLTAQDFVKAWRRVVDPARASPVADDLRPIAGANAIIAGKAPVETLGVRAAAEHLLVVTLERPAAYFPQIMAHAAAFPVYSEAAARAHDPSAWVSNGPYTLSRWQPGARLDLVRNPNYRQQAAVHIARIEYQFTVNEESQYARYRAGELDLTDAVPPNALPALRAAHSPELIIAPYLATAYYGLNLATHELGTQRALRAALALAIDRNQIVEALGFGQTPAYSLVPPGIWNYDPQPWSWRPLSDPERIAEAKRLYAAAGYSASRPLHLRVLFNANVGIKRTAVLIAAQWRAVLGVDTALTEEEYRVFLESRHDKARWDVARLGWSADFNDASNFLDILRTHSVNNDMGYANPAYDALLDRAAAALDAQQRRELLQSAERLMLDDYPVIPLYHLVSKALAKPYVHGVEPSPSNAVPSKSLSLLPH